MLAPPIKILLTIILALGPASLWAENTVPPSVTAVYSIQETSVPPSQLPVISEWISVPTTGINHSFSKRHYYLKVSLVNGAQPYSGILEFPFNRLRQVDMISRDAQGWITVASGANVPMSLKPLRHAAAAFPLEFGPLEKKELYFHVASDSAIKIQLNLKTKTEFFQHDASNLIVYGIYSGLFLLMIIYNLILFWAFREKSYLTYLMTNIAGLVYYLAFDGIWAQYIMPELPAAAHATQAIASLFQSGTYLVFIAQFSPVKRSSLFLHRALYGYGAALILLALFGYFTVGPALMNKLSLNLAISAILLGLASVIIVPSNQNAALRLFKTGNLLLVLFAGIFILFFFGILPDTFLVRNSLRIGTLTELIFFSMALATRIRTIDDSRRHAEVRAEARTQFAANLSHEIRTPLTAIVGVSDLLAETELTAQQKKYVQSLQSATGAMHALANDVLTFAKLDSDKVRVEEISFSPAELIERTIDIYRFKAAEKKIEFSGACAASEGIHLVGDPTKIGQILNNLTGNALKFTPESGRVSIEASVTAVANKHMFEVRVRDTGIGMKKEKLARLFEAYAQADASTERLYGGTGLGLNICKQLAKLMNGNLEAESKIGEGSEFKLTLYLDLAPALVAKTQVDYARIVRQMPRALKILHVDDQPDIRMLFQFYFANTPHQLDSAETAEEGIELFKQHHHDIVFSDVHMPGMGGIQGIAEIKRFARENNLRVKIILCSGSMDPAEMQSSEITVLLKPIRTRDVYAIVAELST